MTKSSEGVEMSAKEVQEELAAQEVRKVHPCAFRSAKGTVWSERGMTKIRLGTTWQNAAESLPAQPENPRADCEGCNKPDCPCNGCDGCIELITERDALEERLDRLAQVVSEHFDVPIGEYSSTNDPIAVAFEILGGGFVTKYDKSAEPKPIPSTPADEVPTKEAVRIALGADDYPSKAIKHHLSLLTEGECRILFRAVLEAKPQPASISSEFEERFMEGQYELVEYNTAWQASIGLGEEYEDAFRAGFDAAWAAAKGSTDTEGR